MFEINKLYSYPEICRAKVENRLTGTQKIAQVERWQGYDKWNKQGTKYLYLGERTRNEIELFELNKTYEEILELFLFSYLGSQTGCKVTITVPKLAEKMCFKNKNYVYGQYNQSEILDLIDDEKLIPSNNEDITSENLKAFFDRTAPSYNRKIKSTLNKMENMGLITYRKYLYLSYKDGVYFKSRLANSKEEQMILDVANEFMSKLPQREDKETGKLVNADKTNLDKKESYIYYMNVPRDFIYKVNHEKNKNDNNFYTSYYYEYEIILSQDAINAQIPYKLENIKSALNSKFIKSMRSNNSLTSFIDWFVKINPKEDIATLIKEQRRREKELLELSTESLYN